MGTYINLPLVSLMTSATEHHIYMSISTDEVNSRKPPDTLGSTNFLQGLSQVHHIPALILSYNVIEPRRDTLYDHAT